jgi:hypothetical protein
MSALEFRGVNVRPDIELLRGLKRQEIRGGIGSWGGKRILHNFASMALGAFGRLHCNRVLATAPR